MSPTSKSKSKDKRAGKEPQKATSKPSGPPNAGGGGVASGYNPLLGTFHTLETDPVSSAPPLHVNGRFQTIDETDDHSGNSVGTGAEHDSVSNNGSWSGESEDQKEKIPHIPLRQEAIPGADNDKREKIRQKNEKKHQRQKEKRAQELHERCSGYLMSRKLETLAQQLVAMGFSLEQATMALILNEGRVEESVAWLFEGGEEANGQREQHLHADVNLKIDISEELARIAEMEKSYNCSKPEVERAIVACEGDLEKAEENLRAQKQEPPPVPCRPEETGDLPTASKGKLPLAVDQSLMTRAQQKSNPSTSVQLKMDGKYLNYPKMAVSVGSSVDPGSKNIQSLKRTQPKMEWAKTQQIAVSAEKRWVSKGLDPSATYSLASPLQAPPLPAKTEPRHVAVENELKSLQLGSAKEPAMVMQRRHSTNATQVPNTRVSVSPPGTTAGWYPHVETMNTTNGLMPEIIPSNRNLSQNVENTNQLYNHHHYLQQQQQFVSGSSSTEPPGTLRGTNMQNRTGTSTTLAPPSSLGLFSGLTSNSSSWSSSFVDWSAISSLPQLHYTNIDWSLDRGSAMSSRASGMWQGSGSSFMQNNDMRTYDSYDPGLIPSSNGNGVPNGGELVPGVASAETSASGGPHEWASPFEESDLFSFTSQFVSSPPL